MIEKIVMITYLLNLIDLLMTTKWIKAYGIDVEKNPIGKWLYKSRARMTFFKVAVPAFALSFMSIFRAYTIAKIGIWTCFGVYLAICLYHLFIYLYLWRKDL